jgi:hypothetical protein
MAQAGKVTNLVSINDPRIILDFNLNPEALRPSALQHPIQSILRCQPALDRQRQNKLATSRF